MTDANDVPQWAIEAAQEIFSVCEPVDEVTYRREVDAISDIIARHAPAPQPDAVGELLKACEPFEAWALTIPPEFEDSLLRDIYASCGDIRELARVASAVRAATATREEGEG